MRRISHAFNRALEAPRRTEASKAFKHTPLNVFLMFFGNLAKISCEIARVDPIREPTVAVGLTERESFLVGN